MNAAVTPGARFLEAELREVRALVERSVRAGPDDVSRGPLRGAVGVFDAVADLASSGGKFLRPAFLLLAARFGDYRPERMRPLAAAIEILHVATLLHDDVIDGADSRRGVPALHLRFGTTAAVLAGDFLMARAFRLASDAASPDDARALSRAFEAICWAEIEQDASTFRWDSGERACLRVMAGKTAALFSLACQVGASRSSCPAKVVSQLRRVGYCVGMAFQALDDVLDYEGDGGELGKPIGADLASGLCTLPLAYALEARGGDLRRSLDALPDAAASQAVAAAVRESGALERAKAFAALATKRAEAHLSALPGCEARDELGSLMESLLRRRS